MLSNINIKKSFQNFLTHTKIVEIFSNSQNEYIKGLFIQKWIFEKNPLSNTRVAHISFLPSAYKNFILFWF